MNRAVSVARMQLINKWTYLGIPAIIIVATFLLTWAIWALIPDGADNLYSGSAQAVMWYFLALGIQAMTLTFPFSQAMSVSRRNFYLGTVGLFAVVALVIAGLYTVLEYVERATNGWGQGGIMFAMPWIADGPWYQSLTFYFVAMVLLFLIGFWAATVYKRWKATGLLTVGIALGVLLVGLAALATMTESWLHVGQWFVAQTPMSISAWTALLSAALAVGSYLTLRRTAP